MLRTITMQGLAFTAIHVASMAAEKQILKLRSTQNNNTVIGVRNVGQGHRVIDCA